MEMLTRDHVKAYKDKIKGALVEYMAMPASERSSGAIRAMLEGWMLLDEVEPSLCGCGEFTKADAEKWAQHMRNTDGSTGAHWSMEQTTSLAESLGVSRDEVSPWCWWVAVNMMYSDYYGVASHFGVATPEFFAELARAFLLDEDGPGPKPKMAAYYCGIVKGKE